MSPRIRRTRTERGFALVITLSLMVLLTIIAVGLLSLGTISLRSTGAGDAQAQAYANARLAVIMAIGQLQKQAGDDRRVTADASILDKTAPNNTGTQFQVAGVWNGWSPKFAATPTQSTVNYTAQKTSAFRGWLMSTPNPADLKNLEFAANSMSGDSVRLFSMDRNGFDLNAPKVPMEQGTVAWVVTQENTKAKVNVSGPEKPDKDLAPNSVLQVQYRPSLHAATGLQNPKDQFNQRSTKVISTNQIKLDGKLAGSEQDLPKVAASYTVHSEGLLTDVVNGGLKADMSLGFELSEGDWTKTTWGDVKNPFRGSALPFTDSANKEVKIPASYAGQVPLFRPIVENPIVSVDVPYDVGSVSERLYGAGVPTFDHLRSFYRLPHYLYGGTTSGGVPSVAERAPDHIAARVTSGSYQFSPGKAPPGRRSATSVKPVLNRMIYLLSMTLGTDNKVRLVITPLVSLWNPYNVALDIEGAVAYPWMDVPFQLNWTINRPGGTSSSAGLAMSRMMGYQLESKGHGRQVNPYFLCKMTSDGTATVTNKPIHFEPGEVRVFAPAKTTPTEYVRIAENPSGTKEIWMRPVDDLAQFSTQGGLLVKMEGGVGGDGNSFNSLVGPNDTVKLIVTPSNNTGAYHYFVTLEDATRIRTPSLPLSSQGGQATADVQMLNFISKFAQADSPTRSYGELKQPKGVPFAVVETFHRTSTTDAVGNANCDLVYSMNPRNPSISHQLSAGNAMKVAPHYQSTLKAVSDFGQALQVTPDGRRSFWGPSHSSSGESVLPFFDIPREPMLSLAGFQHADLSSSAFGPSYAIGNSWASAWLRRTLVSNRNQTYVPTGVPIYDTSYLANEMLYDGYFFSGAAARMSPGQRPSDLNTVYDGSGPGIQGTTAKQLIQAFVTDPLAHPLGNPRMRLHQGAMDAEKLIDELTKPEGCATIAAHLMMDGAFNINSTDKAAWVAVLSAMRGQDFALQDGGTAPTDAAFPRMRHPTGTANGLWNGFRSLSDQQIENLATQMVSQVKARGPFQSMGEFVNRRVENTDLGKSGAIQSAIDALQANGNALKTAFTPSVYPPEAATHIVKFTETGTPGYLSQADVLQSLAPVITCRSDTFVVRGYGEAKDSKGNVIAKAWCEAVVQRMPEYVDRNANKPHSPVASLNLVNQTFGRRFEIVSIRRIPRPEMVTLASNAQ